MTGGSEFIIPPYASRPVGSERGTKYGRKKQEPDDYATRKPTVAYYNSRVGTAIICSEKCIIRKIVSALEYTAECRPMAPKVREMDNLLPQLSIRESLVPFDAPILSTYRAFMPQDTYGDN